MPNYQVEYISSDGGRKRCQDVTASSYGELAERLKTRHPEMTILSITKRDLPPSTSTVPEFFKENDTGLMACETCGESVSVNAGSCPKCGEPNRRLAQARSSARALRVSLAVVFLGIGIFAIGKTHVITSRDLSLGYTVSLKDSFGFSETFIDVDAITGMPWIAARSKYPIGCRFLLENGMVRRATLEESIEQLMP